ncbi:MAG: ABC transporter permease [Homoserinimonas sp.]|nr:ABC transporter permease [Homoserinimonas sp.]
MNTAVAGAPELLRTILRHEGRNFAPWVLIATALSVSSVLVYPWIFPELSDRVALATAIGANPAFGMIFGPAFELTTSDGFNAWRTLALGGFLTGLGSIFAVVRTTRGQEDSGQAELLASGVLGRGSRLLAGVGFALVGSVMVGIVSAVSTGLCGGNWEDSFLLSATFTATGWMFAGVAAICAQLGSSARAANSIAVGILGALFLARGFAYSIEAPDWTVWANPLGWMTETRPASGDNWWPLLYAIAFTVIAILIAFALQYRRDFGFGIIPPRPGPASGKVRSVLALALRINRGPIITWTIAFAVLGIVYGYFATSVHDILAKDSSVAAILAAGATTPEALTSVFLLTILGLVGIIAAVPGVQTMIKVRSEEMEDRVEPLLAQAVSRPKYYAPNVLLALLMPAIYVLIAGLLIAALASSADIGVDFGDTFLQAVATVPAVWTITAVSVAIVGARPKVSIAAWVGVLAAFVLTILGPTFKLWDWILAISPFWHVPTVSAVDADWTGLIWISLVTLFFLAVGFAGFRHRDLAVS